MLRLVQRHPHHLRRSFLSSGPYCASSASPLSLRKPCSLNNQFATTDASVVRSRWSIYVYSSLRQPGFWFLTHTYHFLSKKTPWIGRFVASHRLATRTSIPRPITCRRFVSTAASYCRSFFEPAFSYASSYASWMSQSHPTSVLFRLPLDARAALHYFRSPSSP